jgi:D-amino-acid dehydrogenase
MNTTRKVRNLVIGGGVVGVCTARQLQLRGEDVIILDRVPMGDGCSFGNAGVLCTWSVEGAAAPGFWKDLPRWIADPLGPVSLKLSHLPALAPWLIKFFFATHPKRREEIAQALFTLHNPTVELYRQLLAGTGHESLVVDAEYLFVTRKHAKLNINAPTYRQRVALGASVKAYGPEELREIEPALSHEYVAGIAVQGQGRVTNPGRLVKVIGESVIRDGGEFIQTEARRVTPRSGGGATIETPEGIIEAERLVVAAGAWSHELAAVFGIKVPLQGERGYHMHFANPGVTVNNSVSDVDRKYVASSMEGGVRCAGTSEFNALDAEPDWRRAELMKELGKLLLPDLNVDEGEPWMGRRPALPDTVPVVSKAPSHEGVFFAFGHGHYGLTAAPMTGRLLAGMMTGERMNVDMSPYSIGRYS